MRKAAAFLLWASFTCLQAAPARGAEPAAARAGCIALDAAAEPAQPARPAAPGAVKGDFPATSTVNIVFTASFVPGPSGETPRTAVLTFLTPKGHLYQEIDIPIGRSSGDAKDEKSRLLPGYQKPLPVVHPVPDTRPGSAPRSLLLSLPPLLVGGTSIQQGGLYGAWKAKLRTSDGSSPCSVSFRITP